MSEELAENNDFTPHIKEEQTTISVSDVISTFGISHWHYFTETSVCTVYQTNKYMQNIDHISSKPKAA